MKTKMTEERFQFLKQMLDEDPNAADFLTTEEYEEFMDEEERRNE